MTATQKQIQLAAQLYSVRETARSLLGTKFAERMAEYGAVIQQVAEKTGKDVLAAATAMARDPALSPGTAICVVAAAVELVEPSA